MRVIRHAVRYLVNMSHPEMEAVHELVQRGLIDIMDDADPPLSTSARKSLGYWLPKKRGGKPRNPFQPKPDKKASPGPRTAKTTPEGHRHPRDQKRPS